MFKRILLPTDGSDLSLRAMETGIELAGQLGAKVYVFHVGAPYPAAVFLPELARTSEAIYMADVTLAAERFLNEGRNRAEAAHVPCETGFEFSPHPHRAIVDVAKRQECDLIVMASHSWHGIDRLVMGSETHKVILKTSVPILVCG